MPRLSMDAYDFAGEVEAIYDHDHILDEETRPNGGSRTVRPPDMDVVSWPVCPDCCGGDYFLSQNKGDINGRSQRLTAALACQHCKGVGWVGVPTSDEAFHATLPGSAARVAIFSARERLMELKFGQVMPDMLFPRDAYTRRMEHRRMPAMINGGADAC